MTTGRINQGASSYKRKMRARELLRDTRDSRTRMCRKAVTRELTGTATRSGDDKVVACTQSIHSNTLGHIPPSIHLYYNLSSSSNRVREARSATFAHVFNVATTR